MHLVHVPDLGCGGGLGLVVRALRDVDDAIRIEANLAARTIRIVRAASSRSCCAPSARPVARPILLPLG